MQRFLSVALFVLAINCSTRVLHAQTPVMDDGMVWIALRLVDEDALGGPNLLLEPWIQACTDESPSHPNDWLPIGWRQDNPSQPARELPAGVCEHVIPLYVTGTVGDKRIRKHPIPWQPGANSSRWIGVPREGTTTIRINFPELLPVGEEMYFIQDPIQIKLGGSERIVVVEVPLRRLAQALIHGVENPIRLFDKFVVHASQTNVFLLPGVRVLNAPKEHRLCVVLIDDKGRRHAITSPGFPETFLEISAHFGWKYRIDVIPTRNPRTKWVASLPKPAP